MKNIGSESDIGIKVKVASKAIRDELSLSERLNIWHCFGMHIKKYGLPDERTYFIQEIIAESFNGTVLYTFRNLDSKLGYNTYGFKSKGETHTKLGILTIKGKSLMMSFNETLNIIKSFQDELEKKGYIGCSGDSIDNSMENGIDNSMENGIRIGAVTRGKAAGI